MTDVAAAGSARERDAGRQPEPAPEARDPRRDPARAVPLRARPDRRRHGAAEHLTELNGDALYTWAVTIYLLTSTISGPIYGKLSDLYGRRPIFIWAVGLFLRVGRSPASARRCGSSSCSAACRASAAARSSRSRSRSSPTSTRRRSAPSTSALFGAVFGLSSVVGPGLGGFVTDTFGWPWIFFLNVPLGLVSLFVCWRLLPPIKHPEAGRNIDYVGAALFTAAHRAVPGRPEQQADAAMDRPVGRRADPARARPRRRVPVVESRAADPIIRLGLFRNRTFSISVAAMFLAAFGFFGAIVFLPQCFQVVRA